MYVYAQWYNRQDRCGAVYIRDWSFHWSTIGPVVYRDGRVQTLRERPRRCITVYRRHLYTFFQIPLWRLRSYCEHGFHRNAWWHRCDYVTANNQDGRPSDNELWPDEAVAPSPVPPT